MSHTLNPSVEACRSLFGEPPEDVIGPIKCAAEALAWLAEILRTISSEALDARNGYRIKRLAEAGTHLAFDIANCTEAQHEAMMDCLRTAGVVSTEGDQP